MMSYSNDNNNNNLMDLYIVSSTTDHRDSKLFVHVSMVYGSTHTWLTMIKSDLHFSQYDNPQQHSTNENPSLSRSNFLANLMLGHSDSSWSGSSLPEITEQRFFHVLFYYEQIRL